MSKRNLITKLKHFSKTLFNNHKDTNNHPSAEVQKTKTTKGHEQVSHLYNQTKKQLASKSELFRQYADKAKLLTEKAKNEIHRGTSNMVNSATELKKKLSQEAQSGIEMAPKDKDSLLNSRKKSYEKKQQKSQQANNEIKQKNQQKKGSLYQLGQKMKSRVYAEKQTLQKNAQRIIQSTNSYTKKIMELAKQKIGSQNKESKDQVNHFIEDSSNKNLLSASKQKPIKNQEKQEQNFYSQLKIWEKIKEAQQSALSKLMIKNAQSKMSSMLTNIYWRLIFGACFIVFAFGVSTQIPKEIRIYLTEKDKLQKEQQNYLKAQKHGEYLSQKANL